MIRILFLVLWVVMILTAPSNAAVEVYINGHKYDSIEAYLASKKTIGVEDDYIKEVAGSYGIKVDLSKIKTFQISKRDQPKVSDQTMHKLYVMSLENGVVDALKDFYNSRGQFDLTIPYRISPRQLPDVIQRSVTTSNAPKLLISQPGKVRIMDLSPSSTSK